MRSTRQQGAKTSGREPRPGVAGARHELKAIQDSLLAHAAAAHAAGILSPADLHSVRTVVKQGAHNKVHSAVRAKALQEESQALGDRMVALLGKHGVVPPVAPGSVDNLQRESVTSGAARPLRTTPAVGRTKPESPGERRKRTLAELSTTELEETAQRQRLVSAMEGGLTAAQALQKEGMPVTGNTKRWAQRLYRAFQGSGQLFDGRHAPKPRGKRVMIPAMEAFVEAHWLHHRGASAEGIGIAVQRTLDDLRARIAAGEDVSDDPLGVALLREAVTVPSTQTLYNFFASLGADKALLRKLGYENWVRQNRPITKELQWATRANEEWQMDHNTADIWVRVLDETGLWVAVRPFVTASIDVYSRAITGLVVSARHPDAFTTAITLRTAILPKRDPRWTPRGMPERLVLDNGKDFRAHSVAGILGALRIQPQFCDPHQPDQKPHVERWFGTMTTQLLPLLPGYTQGNDRGEPWTPTRVDRLLTVPQLRSEIERYIIDHYHPRVHGTTGRPPVEMWEEGVPLPNVPSTAELDVLLLHTAERKVVRGLVKFAANGRKAIYYTPGLTSKNGLRVLIRYNPDDLASILLYDAQTGARLGEAWDVDAPDSPYSKADIRAEARIERARMADYSQGLKDRLPQYFAEVARSDRRARERSGAANADARLDVEEVLAARRATAPDGAGELHAAAAARAADEDAVRALKASMRAASQAQRGMTVASSSQPPTDSQGQDHSASAAGTRPRLSRLA